MQLMIWPIMSVGIPWPCVVGCKGNHTTACNCLGEWQVRLANQRAIAFLYHLIAAQEAVSGQNQIFLCCSLLPAMWLI